MNTYLRHILPLIAFLAASCGQGGSAEEWRNQRHSDKGDDAMPGHTDRVEARAPERTDTAVFGAGCFWCVEAVFEQLDGVISVEAGYTGGRTANPTYHDVCTGSTGHAEVARITFDPEVVTFDQLLETFWHAHDPTTLNRQGADAGTQYRSVIFYMDEEQRERALDSKRKAAELFEDPIVTEISALPEFYPAENYHQDYYRSNPDAPYCQVVIRPKLKKLGLKE